MYNTYHPVYPGSISLNKSTGIVIGDNVRNKQLSEVPICDGEQVDDQKLFSDRKNRYFIELEHIKSKLDKEKKAEIEMLIPRETQEQRVAFFENLPKYANNI